MRRTFAVGRLTPDTTEIVLVRPDDEEEGSAAPAPVPGPWSLRAVVRGRKPSRRPSTTTHAHATSRRVH